jgi:uncharacterized membrane protein YraQ (UPF0718 family)
LIVALLSLVFAYGLGQILIADNVDLPNKIQDFFTLSLSIFVEAFPFLVLGSLLGAAVRVFVPNELFMKVLPKNTFLRRAVLSVMGFMFPVCECGNVPISRALIIQGFKPSDAITFLLAAPVLNPVTIWATWTAFGGDKVIVLSRVIATLLIANFIGYIISLKKNQSEFLTESFKETCKTETSSKSVTHQKASRLSKTFTHEAFEMARLLAFGAIVAGVVQTFVPRELLTNIGSNVILSILAMMLLAFVISICANVDAFFALSFAGTFTTGSIVSFLVFGPMIDIKMLIMLKSTFRTNLLVIITTLSFLLSFLTGLLVTYAF